MIKGLGTKILITFILSLITFTQNAHSQKYSIGNQILDEIKLTKDLKIKISGDSWIMVRKEFFNIKTISQKIWGFVRIENGEFLEGYDIVYGDMGVNWIGSVDLWVLEATFKDQYDGCYQKPRYYLVEFYKKGAIHNCLVVSHWDFIKEVYNPDDPYLRGETAEYRQYFKKNNIKVPNIVLNSWHSYFSRHNKSQYFAINHFINPKILNAPKNKYLMEDSSEYHKNNIMNFPKHQKIMDEWVSIASKFHREIEKMLKAKKHHLLDLDKFIISDKEISYNKDTIKQLKQLGDLYKSGVLSKEEFEKAKSKILN